MTHRDVSKSIMSEAKIRPLRTDSAEQRAIKSSHRQPEYSRLSWLRFARRHGSIVSAIHVPLLSRLDRC